MNRGAFDQFLDLHGESSIKDSLRKDHADASKSPKRFLNSFEVDEHPESEEPESKEEKVLDNELRKVEVKPKRELQEPVDKVDKWVKEGRKYPVYLLFNDASSMVSRSIRLFTQSKYSHVSLSTRGLTEFISFGDNAKNDGMVLEGFWEILDLRKPNNIKLTAIMVDESTLVDLHTRITNHKKNINKMKYSYKDLLRFPFLPKTTTITGASKYDFVCSQFIAWLLASMKNGSGVNFLNSISSMNVSPKVLDETLARDTFTVFEGSMDEFKPTFVNEFEKKLGIVKSRKEVLKHAVEEATNKLADTLKDADLELFAESLQDALVNLFDIPAITRRVSRPTLITEENIAKLSPDEIVDKLTEIFNNGEHKNEYRRCVDLLIHGI